MASALIRQCVGFRFFSISSVSSFFASALIQKLYLFHVRKSTSVWGCARQLVGQVSGSGWFVGWSVGKCTCLTTHTAQVLASMFLHVLSFFIFFLVDVCFVHVLWSALWQFCLPYLFSYLTSQSLHLLNDIWYPHSSNPHNSHSTSPYLTFQYSH